jgi:hypothetical protein
MWSKIMAPRKQRIGHRKSYGEPFTFAEADWSHFENHYGHKLNEDVRSLISLATIIFSLRSSPDRDVPRLRPTLTKLRNLQEAVDSLLPDLIQDGEPPKSDLREILDFVSRSKAQVSLFFPIFQFDILAHQLYSLKVICARIEKELCDPDYNLGEKNQQWNVWIVMLTLTLQSSNLPTEVRKDIDKQRAPSEFVHLVREIQNRIPQTLRRPLSDGSLAQAIYRARKALPLDLQGRSPKMVMLTMLGVFKPIQTSDDSGYAELNENWMRFLRSSSGTDDDLL